jgi:polysaccharide pyruvyl transferase WcaK-like protein
MGDPAFMMPAKAVTAGRLGFTLPAGALAVNISPVLLRFLPNTTYDQFVDRCAGCISAFLVAFKRPIVLVYHVMKPGNDDRALLEAALQRVPLARGQVQLLPEGLSAPELKWVISQCDCLVAARTHATIAAFSTFTPTVSIAYSPKAYGINEELFGHSRYVLPFDELDADRLVAITRLVLTDANDIRERLHRSIPEMRERACHGGECLRAMLDARGDLP